MSELRSIQLAIGLAESQRDELALVQARAQRSLDAAQEQMQQLQGYASDTDTRWIGGASITRSTELIRHHYQFMERLQQAIEMQRGVLVKLTQQLELERQAVLQAEFRLSGLNQILKTRKAGLLLKQRKREQQQTDEFAALQHSRIKALSRQEDTHDH